MLLLAKLFGVLVLPWFYLAAKNYGGEKLNWSVVGLIGYWLTWWLSKMLIVLPLADVVEKHTITEFLLTQSPVVMALLVCFGVRKKLIDSALSSGS
jgi:hypothetical protein